MLTHAQLNLRETRRLMKIHLDKFSKEIAGDYKIKVPNEILDASCEEFHNWIMSIKDRVIEAEQAKEIKSLFCLLLNSYLNSFEQITSQNLVL